MANQNESQEVTQLPQPVFMGAAGIPSIEKLEGHKNYDSWKFQMKMILIDYGLWQCVQGTDNNTDRDQRALAKICLSVKSVCVSHVRAAGSSKEAWDNLEKAFQSSSLSRQLSLKRRLYRTRYEDFSSMNEYVSGVLSLVHQLADIKITIADSEIGMLLLSGLPDSYETMLSAYGTTHTTIVSDDVIKTLLEEESRRGFRDEVASGGSAFAIKNTQSSSITCHECGQKGHIRPKCPKLKKGKKYAKNKKQGTLDIPNKFNSQLANKRDCVLFAPSTVFASVDAFEGDKESFYIDSCATNHISHRKDWMSNFNPNSNVVFSTADNNYLCSQGSGNIETNLANLKDHCLEKCVISNVMYAPNAAANLLSVSQLTSKGFTVIFNSEGVEVYQKDNFFIDGKVFFTGKNVGGIYKLDNCFNKKVSAVPNQSAVMSVSKKASFNIWHKRLGHVSSKSIDMLKNLATGISVKNSTSEVLHPCVSCLEAKQTRKSFPKGVARRATERLELIHADLIGPMSEPSLGGAKYVFMLTDDFSRKSFGFMMKSKDETFLNFKSFKNLVENQLNLKIKKFRSDNGTEFCNKKFQQFFKDCGIVHETTVPYTPEQNGVQERANRTVVEKARALLFEAGLPKSFWAEAVNTAIYLKNRSPTAALKNALPEEVWSGQKIDLSHLRIFGCRTFAHIPKQFRGKFDVKSQPMIMVGYCENTKGYRLIDPNNLTSIHKCRDVVFMEGIMHMKDFSSQSKEDSTNTEFNLEMNNLPANDLNVEENESFSDGGIVENVLSENDNDSDVYEPTFEESSNSSDYETSSDRDSNQQNVESESRPGRSRNVPAWQQDYIIYHTKAVEPLNEPSTVKDIYNYNSEDKHLWLQAMKKEYDSLVKNNVFTLVDRPDNTNIVSSKWVFKLKKNANGETRHKARLVARGFSQSYGIDYFETFSPVARISTLRLLIAFSVQFNLLIEHFDVTTAFLHGELEEEVFMTQPECFVKKGEENKVCLLKKAIYGLKQASRAWNKQVNKVLLSIGYRKSENEPCVFYKIEEKSTVIVILYVDDFYVFHNDVEEKERLFNKLQENFDIKDLGEAQQVLGLRLFRDEKNNRIFINQRHYIDEILHRFGFSDCKTSYTPMEFGLKCKKAETVSDNPYQHAIGCLMYLAVNSRPDIAYAVSFLSQFNTCHSDTHWQYVSRIFRYLKATSNLSLMYEKTNEPLHGFVDATWGDDPLDRRSYTGFVFKFASGPISWESRKQTTVALSSSEAEYMAASEASKEALYLNRLVSELCQCIEKPVKLFCDNQSAIKIAENPIFHNRTKHIDIRHHFIRQAVENRQVNLVYKPTEDMVADVLTKSLPKVKHNKCLFDMGVKPLLN